MKTHMLVQHPERFKEYSAQTLLQKESFFDDYQVIVVAGPAVISNQEAKVAKFFNKPVATPETQINVWIDKSILVEGIIGDLLFDHNDDEILTKERLLSVFKLQEEEDETTPAEDEDGTNTTTGSTSRREQYIATVLSMVQFYSCIKMVADGLSFRQTSRTMHGFKDTIGISALGSITPQKANCFVRIASCAANLQTILTMLKEAWAFSIVLDGGNNSNTSYLDMRIRVFSSGSGPLSNLHVVAIPMCDHHTGELMYDLAAKTLDNLVHDWRSRIISITTDGASSMTGQFRGVASRFGNVALPGFYRIWCALHQLDLVLQRLYNSLCDDSFVGTLTSLTGHLCRQYDLIARMGLTCPRFVNTRWMSMSKVIKWLVANRLAVNEYMATRTVNWAPTDPWWIVVCCFNRVIKDVDITSASLQGKQLQVATQRQILEGLKVDLAKIAGAGSILGPLTLYAIAPLYEARRLIPLIPSTQEDAIVALRESHYCKGRFAMKLDDAHKFVDNCGTFVMDRLEELSNPVDGGNLSAYALILDSVARMFVDLIQGINSIQA